MTLLLAKRAEADAHLLCRQRGLALRRARPLYTYLIIYIYIYIYTYIYIYVYIYIYLTDARPSDLYSDEGERKGEGERETPPSPAVRQGSRQGSRCPAQRVKQFVDREEASIDIPWSKCEAVPRRARI